MNTRNTNIKKIETNVIDFHKHILKYQKHTNVILYVNLAISLGLAVMIQVKYNVNLGFFILLSTDFLLAIWKFLHMKNVKHQILMSGVLMLFASIKLLISSLIFMKLPPYNEIVGAMMIIIYIFYLGIVIFKFCAHKYKDKKYTELSDSVTVSIGVLSAVLYKIFNIGDNVFTIAMYMAGVALLAGIKSIIRYIWIEKYNIEF